MKDALHNNSDNVITILTQHIFSQEFQGYVIKCKYIRTYFRNYQNFTTILFFKVELF